MLVILLLVFSFFIARDASADWWDFPNITIPAFPSNTPTPTIPIIFKLNPDLIKGLIGSSPTPTNTPTVTPSITLAPSESVTPTVSIEPTQKEEASPSASPTTKKETKTTVSPTVKQEDNKSIPKEYIYYGVGGLLVLIILIQAWPAIKKILHEKTA